MFIIIELSEVKISDLLRFISGTTSIPAIGFERNLSVYFRHNCEENCQCKCITSTCALTLSLPIHYITYEGIKGMMYATIKMKPYINIKFFCTCFIKKLYFFSGISSVQFTFFTFAFPKFLQKEIVTKL